MSKIFMRRLQGSTGVQRDGECDEKDVVILDNRLKAGNRSGEKISPYSSGEGWRRRCQSTSR